MDEPIIDEKVKTYLVACLVTGIDVEHKPDVFMAGLVEYMNKIERPYWTEGDEDGVIIHTKHDVPLMYIMYNGKRMTFKAFDGDEFSAFDSKKDIGYSLLNVIGYLNDLDLKFRPSILGSEAHVVSGMFVEEEEEVETKTEDWAL